MKAYILFFHFLIAILFFFYCDYNYKILKQIITSITLKF